MNKAVRCETMVPGSGFSSDGACSPSKVTNSVSCFRSHEILYVNVWHHAWYPDGAQEMVAIHEMLSHTGQNGHHLKNIQITNAEEGVEEREPSYTVGGNVNLCSHCGKQ